MYAIYWIIIAQPYYGDIIDNLTYIVLHSETLMYIILNIYIPQRRDCGYPGISQFDCVGKGCCYDSGRKSLRRGHNSVRGIPNCYYSPSSHQDLYFFGHGHGNLRLHMYIILHVHVCLNWPIR